VDRATDRSTASDIWDAGMEGGAGAPSALCFERCTLGGDPADKCHALEHVACSHLQAQAGLTGYCRPICSTDQDCGAGACDRHSGACLDRDEPPDGTFGTSCGDEDARCQGLCIELNELASVCSHRCVFGSAAACAGSSAESRGACVTVTQGGGIGDVGYCMPVCDCPEDCPDKTAVCDPFADATLEATLGALGTCVAPELALHEPIDCR
jgi:hypothetical protein